MKLYINCIPYSKKICGKNFGGKIVVLKLWRIQGLPAFLVHDNSELRKLRNSNYGACTSSSVRDYC